MSAEAIAFAQSVIKDLDATIKKRKTRARWNAGYGPLALLCGWERALYLRAVAHIKYMRQ